MARLRTFSIEFLAESKACLSMPGFYFWEFLMGGASWNLWSKFGLLPALLFQLFSAATFVLVSWEQRHRPG